MSLNIPPIVIVSIFGRGYCLAKSLMSEGIPVRLLDVSHLMGRLDKEEIEGPLPLVDSSYLNLFQKHAWGVSDVDLGGKTNFIVLTENGPVNFASEFFIQRLMALGVDVKLVSSYYQDQNPTYSPMSLDKVWPLALNHKLFSLANFAPAEAYRLPKGSSLRGDIWIREAGAYVKQLQVLRTEQSENFQVLSDLMIEDISFKDRKRIDGILIKKERSEVLKLSQLVWTLSGSETKYISPRLFTRLFNDLEVQPELVWMKWTFKIKIPELPNFFLILNDPCLPWMHQNLLILKQLSARDSTYVVWSLLPSSQRFNRNYLEQESGLLLAFLKQRFSFASVELIEDPGEVHSTFVEKGPALHAVYRPGYIEGMRPPRFDGFFSSGMEARLLQGPNAEFTLESEIEMSILKWWTKEQELARKKEAKLARKQESRS